MAKVRISQRKAPRQERSQQTVEVILEATRRVLVQRGYQNTTTTEIARVAGVSVGSLYQYFPGREALIVAVSRAHSQKMVDRYKELLVQTCGLPLPAAVRVIVRAEVEEFRKNPELHRIVTDVVPRLARPEHVFEVQEGLIDRVAQDLERRSGDKGFPRSREVAFAMVHATDGILQAALRLWPGLIEDPAIIDLCVTCSMAPLTAAMASTAETTGPHN